MWVGEGSLDRRTDRLLFEINALCAGGSYRVVDEGELLSCFPPGDGVDGACVKSMLDYLCGGRYIDLEYAEEGVYCIRPLPEGRLYFERAGERRKESGRALLRTVLVSALSSFFGGALGAFFALLLSSLLG